MKNIIRKILKEERQEQFFNKIILLMKDDFPLFKNLKDYGFNLSEDELNYVLSGIFGEPVEIGDNSIYNQNGNRIYIENSNGDWVKREFDENGNKIYYENSNGLWRKWEYDENGNMIYYEPSDGDWYKKEYDEYGNKTYYENSDGFWYKKEYDENGNEIYFENSRGDIIDNR